MIVLTGLELEEHGARWRVYLDVDGKSAVHLIPVDTMEWRAAEYGIDPADREALLDVVLAEPFIKTGHDDPLSLYNAPTVDEARAYHLQRVAQVKEQHGFHDKAGLPESPRGRLKTESPIDAELLALKREMVESIRQERARSSSPTDIPSAIEMIATSRQRTTKALREYVERRRDPRSEPTKRNN